MQLSYEFEALGDQDAGWAEDYWLNPSGSSTPYAVAIAMSAVRVLSLSSSVNMPYCRIQPIPIGSGVPILLNLRKESGASSIGTQSVAADYQTLKGLLRLVSATGLYTRQWMGGIPGTCFGANGQYTPTASFKTALGTFLNALSNFGFCIRKLNPGVVTMPPQGGLQKQPILSISAAGVLSAPNNGMQPGQLVYVGRVQTGFGLAGFWKIATNDGSNITLSGWKPPGVVVPNTRSQYIQNYQYMYPPIALNTSIIGSGLPISKISRAGKHAVGRPKNPTIGRRKKRVK